MILPDFILPSRINQIWNRSGIDSEEFCKDKKHFKNYPFDVEYKFNSRGFRDSEWSNSLQELKNSNWCVGDSFTVGLGSPICHTWPCILQCVTKTNSINVSMDGASNDWIARKTIRIINEIGPKNLILQWSYFFRTESKDDSLDDEKRRLSNLDNYSIENQLQNFKRNLYLVENNKHQTNIIHTFIPNCFGGLIQNTNDIWKKLKGPSWPDKIPKSFSLINEDIRLELIKFNNLSIFQIYFEFKDLLTNLKYVPEIQILDIARDGHHYDKLTASKLVDNILPLLC